MDARQLRYFLAVVDHGGFGRAADQLLVSQPSLSQAVASLERSLGVELFHRVGRRATLSAAGEELVGHARVVMRDLESARAAMDAIRGVHTGRVDISSMPSPGIEPLTSIIAAFRERHPHVTISVDGAFSPDDVIAAVRTGTAEIGILGSASEPHVPGVRSLPLLAQPLMLIVNPLDDHFGDVTTIRATDLAGSCLIASQRGSLMRTLVDELLTTGTDVELAVEVAHRTSILPLVLAGVGHAVMPSAWEPLATQSGLRTLRFVPTSSLHVSVISRAEHLSNAAIAFLEIAEEFVKR